MSSFESLYDRLLNAGMNNKLDTEISEINSDPDVDKNHLDCLLKPEKYPAIIKLDKCTCSNEEQKACINSCDFDAIHKSTDGGIEISKENCVGCGDCLSRCKPNNLAEVKEFIPVLDMLKNKSAPVYAMIAPAYIGQFMNDVTPGMLRTAFKNIGFEGLIEVALFADILTLKEALEFDKTIKDDDDFMLTSCCCPMWIAMIKKVYHKLVPHLPPAVSPMTACARAIKKLHPNAKTVFIGPCVAKKAEAKNKDIEDATDYVLTFQEMKQVFDVANIHPEDFKEDIKDHSSKAGIIYARTAGVSQAVQSTLDRLKPERSIPLKSIQADGVMACKNLLKDLVAGDISANFIEGMGCVGGCVGGPKALIDKEKGTEFVNNYGDKATYKTPVDNPYVIELLAQLGFNTIESLLEGDTMFTRDFTI